MKYEGERRQDWVLLMALEMVKKGDHEGAESYFRTLIDFNANTDPPYNPNAEAIAYAGKIAQIAGFKEEAEELKKRFDEAKSLEDKAEELSLDLERFRDWDLV